MLFLSGLIAEEAGECVVAVGRCKNYTAESKMRIALADCMIPYDDNIMAAIRTIKHCLDVWHKSIKISNKVIKAGEFAQMKDLKAWSPAVQNHFWYAAKTCDGNTDNMKVRVI